METDMINRTATNAEIVRRGYEAFNKADIVALNEIFHDDSSWHTPGKSSIGGNREGKEAIFTQFGRYGGETNGTFKAMLKTVAVCDDGRIVGIHHNSGERNGKNWMWIAASCLRSKTDKFLAERNTFSTLMPGTHSGRNLPG